MTLGIAAACVAVGGFSIMLLGSSRTAQQPAARPRTGSATPASRGKAASAGDDVPSLAVPAPAAIATSAQFAGEKAYGGGDLNSAVKQFQAAVDANPNDARALNSLAQLLVRLGRSTEAIQYLDRAVRIAPDNWAYQFNRARAYAQTQQWGEAITGYRTAERLFPADYATTYNLAKALQAGGDLEGAIASYQKAIQLAPGQSDFQLSYGLALELAKRPQDAAAAYRRYLELEPQSAEAEKVKAHLAELQPQPTTAGVGS
jgi:tetratricopeptide (TPR) repeat protein